MDMERRGACHALYLAVVSQSSRSRLVLSTWSGLPAYQARMNGGSDDHMDVILPNRRRPRGLLAYTGARGASEDVVRPTNRATDADTNAGPARNVIDKLQPARLQTGLPAPTSRMHFSQVLVTLHRLKVPSRPSYFRK